jgi:capsid portal protein
VAFDVLFANSSFVLFEGDVGYSVCSSYHDIIDFLYLSFDEFSSVIFPFAILDSRSITNCLMEFVTDEIHMIARIE